MKMKREKSCVQRVLWVGECKTIPMTMLHCPPPGLSYHFSILILSLRTQEYKHISCQMNIQREMC